MVYLNGRFVGLAPLSLNVPKGKHYVWAVQHGHELTGRTLEIKRDEQAVSLALPKQQNADTIDQLMTAAVLGIGETVMPEEALDVADYAGAQDVVLLAAEWLMRRRWGLR